MRKLEIEQKQKRAFFKSKPFFVVLAILLAIGLSVGGYLVNIEKEEKAYESKLTETIESINEAYEEAQPMTVMFSKVWSASINGDVRTDKLANALNVDESVILSYIPNGHLIYCGGGRHCIKQGDFYTGLQIVYLLKKEDGYIGKLESKREEIEKQVKDLKNPPMKYEYIQKEVLNYYSIYEKYLELAISPKGSYLTYTEQVNNLSTEIENQYKKLKVSLP